jgi:hypothetical protein
MKRTILAAAAFALATTAFSQTTIYETGFESAQEFNEGPLPDTGLNWKQKGTQPFAIVAKDGDAADQILECRSDTPGTDGRLWLTGVGFPEDGYKMVIEFQTRLEKSGAAGFQGNLHIGNFPAAPGIKSTGMAVIISFRGSGKIRTYDGDTEIEIGNWREGEWMNFRVELDPGTKTFSIHRDEEMLASDYAFADGEAVPVRSFGLTYYNGSEATKESALAIDSFKISHQ